MHYSRHTYHVSLQQLLGLWTSYRLDWILDSQPFKTNSVSDQQCFLSDFSYLINQTLLNAGCAQLKIATISGNGKYSQFMMPMMIWTVCCESIQQATKRQLDVNHTQLYLFVKIKLANNQYLHGMDIEQSAWRRLLFYNGQEIVLFITIVNRRMKSVNIWNDMQPRLHVTYLLTSNGKVLKASHFVINNSYIIPEADMTSMHVWLTSASSPYRLHVPLLHAIQYLTCKFDNKKHTNHHRLHTCMITRILPMKSIQLCTLQTRLLSTLSQVI